MITVYSKPNCPQCDATKRHLARLGVTHTIIDVTADPAALDVVRGMGYTAVPVVVAGDDHWSGFRPDRLNALATGAAA